MVLLSFKTSIVILESYGFQVYPSHFWDKQISWEKLVKQSWDIIWDFSNLKVFSNSYTHTQTCYYNSSDFLNKNHLDIPGMNTIFKWHFFHWKMDNIYWLNSIFAAYPALHVRRSDCSCFCNFFIGWVVDALQVLALDSHWTCPQPSLPSILKQGIGWPFMVCVFLIKGLFCLRSKMYKEDLEKGRESLYPQSHVSTFPSYIILHSVNIDETACMLSHQKDC